MSGFRYASSLGERYCMPMYYRSAEEAIEVAEMAQRLLGGLAGQDSMRVEALTPEGEWLQLWPEVVG